ncbi:UNVERIFIED_CONTAM: hypothetical protein GTU68_013427 [Idotea baltica]|nr:hypothetical protein [Idotea baltica]
MIQWFVSMSPIKKLKSNKFEKSCLIDETPHMRGFFMARFYRKGYGAKKL